jgi:hypothetical protein
MNIEEAKNSALNLCMDIAIEYTKEEVEKFALVPVQKAWKIGREALDFEIAKQRERNKDFQV